MPDLMGSLHPYPTSLPNDLIDRAIDLLSGQGVEKEDAHRLWHVSGVILSKWDDHAPMLATLACTPEQGVALLQAMKTDGTMKAIDWAKLKPLAKLILQFLINAL